MRFSYPLWRKFLFYLGYFFRKIFSLWLEVKRPKIKMFLYEIIYSAKKLPDPKSLYVSPFSTDTVETVFGTFRIRPHSTDMATASPAFERPDMNYLLKLIGELSDEGKKILFLDIGADIGTFSIAVGNRFNDYSDLNILAFEPASSSYELLKENLKLNNLDKRAEAFNFPLYSEDGLELELSFNPENPGGSGLSSEGAVKTERVVTRSLDSVIDEKGIDYDAAIMKIDVEGAECKVLKGAREMLSTGKDVFIMVEDFVEPGIIPCLEDSGGRFMVKLTPYNSFWVFRAS